MRSTFSFLIVCTALSFFAVNSAARAASLNVVGGTLVGASNVDVDGQLFDVEFVDGRCIDLFDGCDDASDFDFDNESAARLGSSGSTRPGFCRQ